MIGDGRFELSRPAKSLDPLSVARFRFLWNGEHHW